jgi:hypothetical protein
LPMSTGPCLVIWIGMGPHANRARACSHGLFGEEKPGAGGPRRGYSLDTLIAKHGRQFGIPDLLRLLSADCPKRQSVSAYDLCGVHCPELTNYFHP